MAARKALGSWRRPAFCTVLPARVLPTRMPTMNSLKLRTCPPRAISVNAAFTSGLVQNWGATSSRRLSPACEEGGREPRGGGGEAGEQDGSMAELRGMEGDGWQQEKVWSRACMHVLGQTWAPAWLCWQGCGRLDWQAGSPAASIVCWVSLLAY